ncbi:Golgi to ER traffic protein 4 homolog isoform X1 [Enhydra lutris kenyoni]|uniref:Golgi to ER traffic protein 4 homolog isoform X1 n=2 Tax=Mustelidae TaxID=9655 RepID=A0A2Y9J8M6_ENHLU|nr:Golgi to ER traffic protein 4 homolog isoform X1 [Enhydra lutris kenyoni]
MCSKWDSEAGQRGGGARGEHRDGGGPQGRSVQSSVRVSPTREVSILELSLSRPLSAALTLSSPVDPSVTLCPTCSSYHRGWTCLMVYMSQNKHTEARELMCSGALLFFSHGQQNSAADLSMLVLESLEKAEVEVADELLENLAKLFSLMDPNSPERVAFVSRALKWSSGGSGKLGHPRLHQLLALTLWKEQNYCESRYHFLHSADGEGCAHMLVEYSTSRGFRSEVDMFVAQAVLQFLCLKNKSSASVVFTTYTQKHPSIEHGPPFVQPLLNFIWFLLLAVDGGKLTVFTVLCEQYQPSLRRDPMYNEYLDRIGQLFFGVPPKQTSSYGGLLGNLLSSLMGASEQEGEDSQDDSSPIELD